MNHNNSDSAAAYCLRGAVACDTTLERIQAAAEALLPQERTTSLTSPAAASAAVGAFWG